MEDEDFVLFSPYPLRPAPHTMYTHTSHRYIFPAWLSHSCCLDEGLHYDGSDSSQPGHASPTMAMVYNSGVTFWLFLELIIVPVPLF